jgi:YegS/Rv2252/BmrU family lipid kinase
MKSNSARQLSNFMQAHHAGTIRFVEEVFVFANPIAGRGRGQDMAGRITRRLERDGYRVRAFLDPADQVPDAMLLNAPGARAIVSIGGDGTLRHVIERLIRIAGASPPPLLVVPLGTANLMGRHLGVAWDDRTLEDRVSASLGARRITLLDAARANDRPFLLMTGVGIDAHIVHELDRLRTGPIDIASYLLPAALALHAYTFPPLLVTVDGESVFGPRPAIAFVGNISEYGTGFPMLPNARSDDGLLDVCALRCDSRAELLRLFLLAAAGEHTQSEGAVHLKGKRVRVESSEPAPVQIDGEAAGFTPVEIDLIPFKLPFIVPA